MKTYWLFKSCWVPVPSPSLSSSLSLPSALLIVNHSLALRSHACTNSCCYTLYTIHPRLCLLPHHTPPRASSSLRAALAASGQPVGHHWVKRCNNNNISSNKKRFSFVLSCTISTVFSVLQSFLRLMLRFFVALIVYFVAHLHYFNSFRLGNRQWCYPQFPPFPLFPLCLLFLSCFLGELCIIFGIVVACFFLLKLECQ